MPNNFKKNTKDQLISHCTVCHYGIYRLRDEGQYGWNPNPKATGLCHNWCMKEDDKMRVGEAS